MLSDNINTVMVELDFRLKRDGQIRIGWRLAESLVACLKSCLAEALWLQNQYLALHKPAPNMEKGSAEAYRKLDTIWADEGTKP